MDSQIPDLFSGLKSAAIINHIILMPKLSQIWTVEPKRVLEPTRPLTLIK